MMMVMMIMMFIIIITIIIMTIGCRREAMARQANRDEAKKMPAIR